MPAGSGGVAHALFVSKDRRIPKIRIQTRQLGNLLNKRIVVAVDSWDVMSRYPSGHYVRTIGDIGDKETETEASFFTYFLLQQVYYYVRAADPTLPKLMAAFDASMLSDVYI
jgi:exoribonuclease R